MDINSVCPVCHRSALPEYYFCPNCGKNLKPVPLSTTVLKQLGLYIGSVVLMPLGLIWGLRYLKESTLKAKLIGWACIVITIVSFVIISVVLFNTIREVNEQVNQQLNGLSGF